MKHIIVGLLLLCSGSLRAQPSENPLADMAMSSLLHHQTETTIQPLTVRSLVIPAACLTYGFLALRNHDLLALNHSTRAELQEDHPHFMTPVDNYLQFSPGLAVFGLHALGIPGKHSLGDQSILYGMTILLSTAVVFPLKSITHEQRPDQSGYNSFPSGHTTMAFASAEFLRQEYENISCWYGVAGYAVATATGILRMYNNKHWLSDIVAGAGMGILSARVVYWIYPRIREIGGKKKFSRSVVMPFYQQGGGGLAWVYHFGS